MTVTEINTKNTKHKTHKHRLPIHPKTLIISEKMKCREYDECNGVYNYFTGAWKTK